MTLLAPLTQAFFPLPQNFLIKSTLILVQALLQSRAAVGTGIFIHLPLSACIASVYLSVCLFFSLSCSLGLGAIFFSHPAAQSTLYLRAQSWTEMVSTMDYYLCFVPDILMGTPVSLYMDCLCLVSLWSRFGESQPSMASWRSG